MIFNQTKLKDAFIIDLQKIEDERGFFARTWCQKEFSEHGLNPRLVQSNISFSKLKGTLRGMHYQVAPFAEAKLIRCTKGSIFDVIVDIRPDSPTYKQYISVTLTPHNRTMLYVPEGFAHGFITMEDYTEVCYQMSEFYSPHHARGFRWNDKAFAIEWPLDVQVISERDNCYPDYFC